MRRVRGAHSEIRESPSHHEAPQPFDDACLASRRPGLGVAFPPFRKALIPSPESLASSHASATSTTRTFNTLPRNSTMSTPRILRPTVYLPSRDAAALRRALRIWLETGSIPVAHIVAEPDTADDHANDTSIAA
jgi:hypothetical protein